VARDGAGPAWFDVMRQGAEVVDLRYVGAVTDGVEQGLTQRADVEPAAVGAAFAPCFSYGVVQVEPVHEEAD